MSEWEAVKEGLRRIELYPEGHLINARFANALRLIMEKLEEINNE